MRIVHAIWSDELAGAERYCASLATMQAARGEHVTVLTCPRQRSDSMRSWLGEDVELIEAGGDDLERVARTTIDARQPDVVHTHLETSNCLFGRLRPDAALVSTLHVGYSAMQFTAHEGLICLTRAQRRTVEDAGCDRELAVIGAWVYPDPRDSAATQTSTLRARLGLRPDHVVFGGVGRLHRRKGFAELIAAFGQLPWPEARLLIIGGGPEREVLAALSSADERVILLGPQVDIQPYYRAIDVFVSPSWTETFGLAVLEAMALGCPIVSTATEGPASHLPADALVPVRDVPALARALAAAPRDRRRCCYDMARFDAAQAEARIRSFYAGLI